MYATAATWRPSRTSRGYGPEAAGSVRGADTRGSPVCDSSTPVADIQAQGSFVSYRHQSRPSDLRPLSLVLPPELPVFGTPQRAQTAAHRIAQDSPSLPPLVAPINERGQGTPGVESEEQPLLWTPIMSPPTNVVTIELPIEGLPALTDPTDEFADEARFLLALKLFEQGRISSGKAGTLCGLGRVGFLVAASRAGVPVVDLGESQLGGEFAP